MPEAISPEGQVLLCCARREIGAATRVRIAELLAGGCDWEQVYALAERHSLRPLLFRHLGEGSMGIPAKLESRLWQHSQLLRARNRQMETELVGLLDALKGEGIAVVCHKGPVLARLAFGDAGLREYGDLDILVQKPLIERAKSVLRAHGYQSKYPMSPAAEKAFMESPAQYHFMLAHEVHGMLLELHWKTDGDNPTEDMSNPDWWDGLARLHIGDREVACLSPRETALALLVHGSKHQWDSLHWLADVAELLRAFTEPDWEWLLARTDEMKVRRRVAFGVLLLDRHLGLESRLVNSALAAELQLLSAPANQVAWRWFGEAPRPASAWERLELDMKLCDGPRQRFRRAVDSVARPGVAEWSRWPLPRGLFFLYLPLRAARLFAKRIGVPRPSSRSGN